MRSGHEMQATPKAELDRAQLLCPKWVRDVSVQKSSSETHL